MRLIDADALLKRVDEERKYLIARGQTGTEHILVHNFRDLIDDAPTVEPEITDDDLRACMKESHNLGYELAEIKFKKPQGEWLEDKIAFHFVCDQCGCALRQLKSEVFEGDFDYNFCPNCGAQMKTRTQAD